VRLAARIWASWWFRHAVVAVGVSAALSCALVLVVEADAVLVGTPDESEATGVVTLDVPAGAAGDTLVLWWWGEGSGHSSIGGTAAAAFDLVCEVTTGNYRAAVYAREAGSEPSTYTISGAGDGYRFGSLARFSGIDPLDTECDSETGSSSLGVGFPTAAAGDLIAVAAGMYDVNTWSAGGVTELQDDGNGVMHGYLVADGAETVSATAGGGSDFSLLGARFAAVAEGTPTATPTGTPSGGEVTLSDEQFAVIKAVADDAAELLVLVGVATALTFGLYLVGLAVLVRGR